MITYRLNTRRGYVTFKNYQAMLAALYDNRDNLDHITLDELDEIGNVHARLSNDEIRQIVAELDGIVLPTVQARGLKDT